MKKTAALLMICLSLAACQKTAGPSPFTIAPGGTTGGSTVSLTSATSVTSTSISTLPSTTTTGSIKTELIPPDAKTSTQGQFDWRNATVYYAMTDRFYNGDPTNDQSYGRQTVDAKGSSLGTFNGGDFKGLTTKLREGYFTDLGINAIWITAPYEQIHGFVSGGSGGEFAHYGFHGYYALDWTVADRNFGTIAEFEEMVDTAHSQGIRIILDVVMNHVGYNTLLDMEKYDFGAIKGISGNWQPQADQRYDAYNEFIDYQDEAAWAKWWGMDWIRAGLPGYDRGGADEYTQTLAGLPDIKTEAIRPVNLPPVLKTKWSQEAGGVFAPWKLPSAQTLRQNMDLSPAGYITAWLSAWVEEFGIDGFRIDTAKHVEKDKWQALKKSADGALKAWRQENPKKPGAEFTDDFFMVGEVWGMGIPRNEYYDFGFDALINFSFQGEGFEGPVYRPAALPGIYQTYADTLNQQNTNVLSYISSHDTKLFPRNQLIDGLTAQLLLPGGVEIFYGDETGRPYVSSGSDITMGTRSYMNWNTINKDIQSHFQKISRFRARNLALGAGSHLELSRSPFIFQREYNKAGIKNTVVVAWEQKPGSTIDVSRAFSEGDLLRDAYTQYGYRVLNGKVTVDADPSGIVLLEKME